MANEKQCPYCDNWYRNLGAHMSKKHGGAPAAETETPSADEKLKAEPEAVVVLGDVFDTGGGRHAVCVAVSEHECQFHMTPQLYVTRTLPYHRLREKAKSLRPDLVEHNILNGVWTFVENLAAKW